MNTLSMNQLNDFIRLGPQVYPERPNAVQVIERGPHGKRFARDPVVTRETRQRRGSGFQFWVEEMNVPADLAWNPRQRVVGLLGMGSEVTRPVLSNRQKAQFTKLAKELRKRALSDHPVVLPPLIHEAQAMLAALNAHQPFTESVPIFSDDPVESTAQALTGPLAVIARLPSASIYTWSGSQTIRANLQAAIQSAKRRLVGEPVGTGASQEQVDTSRVGTTTEVVIDAGKETSRRVGEAARRADELLEDPLKRLNEVLPYAVGGVALLIGVYAFAGGFGRSLGEKARGL